MERDTDTEVGAGAVIEATRGLTVARAPTREGRSVRDFYVNMYSQIRVCRSPEARSLRVGSQGTEAVKSRQDPLADNATGVVPVVPVVPLLWRVIGRRALRATLLTHRLLL